MTTSVQRRRGTTAQHSTFTGLEGEITIDTTKDTAVIHDGATVGGFPLLKESLINANPSTLSSLTGSATATDDVFYIYDTSATTQKKITRAELNNAIGAETFTNISVSGGAINNTAIGAGTASTGNFSTLSIGGSAITATPTELNVLDGITASTTELNYVDGVTSNIQTQLDSKAALASPTFTGTLATAGLNVTGNTILGTNSSNTLAVNAIATIGAAPILSYGTANQVQYLDGSKNLAGSSNMTFDGTKLTIAGLKNSALTSTRLVYAGASGELTDSADLTFSGTALTVNGQLNLTNSSNYNLYASGAGANYMAGSLGIGTTSLTDRILGIGKTANAVATSLIVTYDGAFPATVTNGQVFSSSAAVSTGATLSFLQHFRAQQGSFAGTVTDHYGFHAASNLVGATNNYGFFSNIPAATGRWNFFSNGTAGNYMAGSLGIGTTAISDRNLGISKNITGATGAYGIVVNGQIQSDVTSVSQYFRTTASTAAAFTLTTLDHFVSAQGTFGAGSSVTTQAGFNTSNSLINATNNYGFYGAIPATSGRYNLYMAGTADNYMAGNTGIGIVPAAQVSFHIGKALTGATTAYSQYIQSTIQSDVTNAAYGIRTGISSVNSAFTLVSLNHFAASQGTFGASSSITNQIGFRVESTMISAVNNHGIRSQLAAATGAYNLYMDGTANNYLAGSLWLGTNNQPTVRFDNLLTITGGTVAYGVRSGGIIQSDVTSTGVYFASTSGTAATTFSINGIKHYSAVQGTFGAGSTVTNQYGFVAENTLTGATNNYGFLGVMAAASGAWNFYASGTANNYMAGSLGIGNTSLAAHNLFISKTLTGGTSAFGVRQNGQVQSDVTSAAYGFISQSGTQTATFTLSALRHFQAGQGAFGVGSTITNQTGFRVESSLTGATNNYSYLGEIASATGAYNLYMSGTASNYLAGKLGLGVLGSTYTLDNSINITGNTDTGAIRVGSVIQSDVTSAARIFTSAPSTVASAFTLSEVRHFNVSGVTIGAGSTVTTQTAFFAQSQLTTATNNWAFYGALASATGRYNLYMAGTAQNYLAGNTQIANYLDITTISAAGFGLRVRADSTDVYAGIQFTNNSASAQWAKITSPAANVISFQDGGAIEKARLDSSGNFVVTGSGGLGYGAGSGGAVTQGTSRTTGVTLNKTNGSITLVSAAGSTTIQSFTVTNSTVAATDTIIVSQKSGTDLYRIYVTAVAVGSFRISYATLAGTTTEQPVFNFAVIKAVVA